MTGYYQENGEWWYRSKVQRQRVGVYICQLCGKEFPRVKTAMHKYCSKQCSNKVTKEIHRKSRKGDKNPSWKGGRNRTGQGYIRIYSPDHPYAEKIHHGVLEHRLVMEKILGRYLLPFETVHHKNGVRDDNRPENLELWMSKHPPGQRVEELIEYAKWILEIYSNLNNEKTINMSPTV